MPRWSAFAVVLLAAALTTPMARADLDIATGNAARVLGRIDPAGETETFRVTMPKGAVRGIVLKGGKGKAAAPATLQLFAPDGSEIAQQAIVTVGTGAKLTKFAVAATGEHRVVVRGDGAHAVDYDLTIAWKDVAKVPITGDLTAADVTVPLSFDAGSTVTFDVKPSKGSAAVPRLISLDPVDGGPSIAFPAPANAASKGHKVAGIVIPKTADYVLHVSAKDAAAGIITGSVSIRAPSGSGWMAGMRSTTTTSSPLLV